MRTARLLTVSRSVLTWKGGGEGLPYLEGLPPSRQTPQTGACENITFRILRMMAVKNGGISRMGRLPFAWAAACNIFLAYAMKMLQTTTL